MKNSRLKTFGLAAMLSLGLTATSSALAQADCKYLVTNSWGGGAIATIEITNNSTTAINGWNVNWSYNNNSISNLWNADLSGTNPYSASNLSWNANIQPGQTISFGMQVNTNGAAETPTVSGNVCGNSTSSTPSSSSSSISSSSVSSSGCATVRECNWYGTIYPICVDIHSGLGGLENDESCLNLGSCSGLPAPYGLVNTEVCPGSSSSSASSVPPISSSARSSSSAASSIANPGGMTSVELTQVMGVGWNLGNSLEAIGGETAWGNPLVTQQLINSVKAAGFDTLRVPVAWSKFSDEANFVIDSSWMARVEEVVNYALNADMYVIMNIHWDGGWMQPTYAQQNYVNNRLSIMWEQIATHFRDYDDRLLFAGTNEVMVEGDYGTPTEEYYTVQNSFNQTFVTTVRATGGRNATRHLVVQGFNTNIDHTVNFADIPVDTVADRLMMEVHYYDPYNFTLNENSNITQWGAIATDPNATETWANEAWVDTQFQRMKTNFVDQGIGVILGEYGVISRPNVANHEVYRTYWNEYITESAVRHGLVPVYWDNGYAGNAGMAIFDRNNGNQLYPAIIDAIVSAVE